MKKILVLFSLASNKIFIIIQVTALKHAFETDQYSKVKGKTLSIEGNKEIHLEGTSLSISLFFIPVSVRV